MEYEKERVGFMEQVDGLMREKGEVLGKLSTA